jgi:hypothetical protein
MREQTAEAVSAKAPVGVEIDWSKADDHALVGGMLADDEGAWLEFLGRFDELVTKRIGVTLGRWSRMLRTTDMIETIKSEIHAYLVSCNMRPLRAFDSRHGTLAAWVSKVAHQSAMRRLQALTNITDDDENVDLEQV